MSNQSTEDLPDPTLADYIWFYGLLYAVSLSIGVLAVVSNPEISIFSTYGAFGVGFMFFVTTGTILFLRS